MEISVTFTELKFVIADQKKAIIFFKVPYKIFENY